MHLDTVEDTDSIFDLWAGEPAPRSAVPAPRAPRLPSRTWSAFGVTIPAGLCGQPTKSGGFCTKPTRSVSCHLHG